MVLNNYKPISIPSSLNEIFEITLHKHLVEYWKKVICLQIFSLTLKKISPPIMLLHICMNLNFSNRILATQSEEVSWILPKLLIVLIIKSYFIN